MANTTIQPYLFFGGRCEEALEFYGKALGAQVDMLMKYSDSPEPPAPGTIPPGFENKVMHASFRIGGNTLMGSDGNEVGAHFNGFSLSISLPTEEETRLAFDALSESAEIMLPLSKTFWSPCFGMLTDKFGLGWMVAVAEQSAPGASAPGGA